MKIKPLYDRMIVKQKKEKEMTAGGIFIPHTGQEKPMEGEVLAVGQGQLLDNGEILPLTVKVGDVVMFPKHSYAEVKVDHEDYLIIREENVLAIITE